MLLLLQNKIMGILKIKILGFFVRSIKSPVRAISSLDVLLSLHWDRTLDTHSVMESFTISHLPGDSVQSKERRGPWEEGAASSRAPAPSPNGTGALWW